MQEHLQIVLAKKADRTLQQVHVLESAPTQADTTEVVTLSDAQTDLRDGCGHRIVESAGDHGLAFTICYFSDNFPNGRAHIYLRRVPGIDVEVVGILDALLSCHLQFDSGLPLERSFLTQADAILTPR